VDCNVDPERVDPENEHGSKMDFLMEVVIDFHRKLKGRPMVVTAKFRIKDDLSRSKGKPY
jgi:hypothetical protein